MSWDAVSSHLDASGNKWKAGLHRPPPISPACTARVSKPLESQATHFSSLETWMTASALPSPHYHTGSIPTSCLLPPSHLAFTFPSLLHLHLCCPCVSRRRWWHTSCPNPPSSPTFLSIECKWDSDPTIAAWILKWSHTHMQVKPRGLSSPVSCYSPCAHPTLTESVICMSPKESYFLKFLLPGTSFLQNTLKFEVMF